MALDLDEPGTGPARRLTISFGPGREWSLPQLALALLACLGSALYLASLWQATGGFDPVWWGVVAVPLLTISYSSSAAALAFWALLLVVWFQLTPSGSFTWWSVPAAVGLLLGHATTALAATAPPTGSFTVTTTRRWLRASARAALAAPAVALLATLTTGRGHELSSAAYVIGLGGLALGLLLARSEPPVSPD